MGEADGHYASSDYEGWMYVSPQPQKQFHLNITLARLQGTVADWNAQLAATEQSIRHDADREVSRQWWRGFWQRSYVEGLKVKGEGYESLIRNYQLFRYMLGCNSRGQWPTKFNGGL